MYGFTRRTSRGTVTDVRFLGRGRGQSGLVGLLVALVVLGVMAAVAFATLSGSGGDSPSQAGGLSAEVVPAARADVDAVSQSGQALRAGIAEESRNACLLDARTLSTAAQTYQAVRSSPPATVDDLVAAGLLSQPPSSGHVFTFESVDGKPTGRVLVDGADPATGCATAPAG